MIRTGTVFAKRYEILEKIGSGGMADVYRARDLVTSEIVAIKALKASLSYRQDAVNRFEEEGRLASEFESENIVRVYDVGESAGTYYIVMEYVEGMTLKDYIRKKGMLSVRESLAIAAQAAVGLRTAHAHHLVHRDIKPQNLILSKDGKVKITDFGIARDPSKEHRALGEGTVGSVYYIAPEIVKGQAFDERSDIYSLGICMYEMITGQVPFDKETTMAVALAHMNESMVPPSDLNPDCPISLEQIIFRCTQKSKERRYRNCTELLKDLRIAVETPDYNFEKKEQEKLLRSNTQVFAAGQLRAPKTAETKAPVNETERHTLSEADDQEPRRVKTKKPLPKKPVDRVLNGVTIALGAVMIALIVYILCSFFGCNGSNTRPTKSPDDRSTEEQISTVETKHENDYNPETDAIMPNLIGKSLDDALALLEEADLDFRISSEEEYTDEYPLGAVTRQMYPEGAIIPKRTVVVIVLNSGSDTFEIDPSWVGRSINLFRNAVAPYTTIINVEYERQYSETVEQNMIISIKPGSGTVKRGGSIHVVYSVGKPIVEVPDLSGMSVEKAREALTKLGLNAGTVQEAYNSDFEAGLVFSQNPKAKSNVRKGSTVEFSVSLGPEKFTVPDVTGQSVADAKQKLESIGFTVIVCNQYSEDEPAGKLLSQYPSGGTSAKQSDIVYLYQASLSEQVVVPGIIGLFWNSEVKNWLHSAAYKFSIREVNVNTTDPAEDLRIIDVSPKAGTTVERKSEITLTIRKYNYVEESTTETESVTESETESATETVTETELPTETSTEPETVTETESVAEPETEPISTDVETNPPATDPEAPGNEGQD